jgi:hypothetical protein
MTAREYKEVHCRGKYNNSMQMCTASIHWASFRGASVLTQDIKLLR